MNWFYVVSGGTLILVSVFGMGMWTEQRLQERRERGGSRRHEPHGWMAPRGGGYRPRPALRPQQGPPKPPPGPGGVRSPARRGRVVIEHRIRFGR